MFGLFKLLDSVSAAPSAFSRLCLRGSVGKDGWLHQLIKKATPAVGSVLIDRAVARVLQTAVCFTLLKNSRNRSEVQVKNKHTDVGSFFGGAPPAGLRFTKVPPQP